QQPYQRTRAVGRGSSLHARVALFHFGRYALATTSAAPEHAGVAGWSFASSVARLPLALLVRYRSGLSRSRTSDGATGGFDKRDRACSHRGLRAQRTRAPALDRIASQLMAW